jgi:hypothetical protein
MVFSSYVEIQPPPNQTSEPAQFNDLDGWNGNIAGVAVAGSGVYSGGSEDNYGEDWSFFAEAVWNDPSLRTSLDFGNMNSEG